jgi:glycine/D-amino acid oxidase-like deaminating enzyme
MPGMPSRLEISLPERASIAIVGGGLGAAACAEALGAAGRDAIWLDPEFDSDPSSVDPSLGTLRAGPAIHYARLAAGHGEDLARACLAAGQRNVERLRAFTAAASGARTPAIAPAFAPGTLVRLAGDDEGAELQASVDWLRGAGVGVETAPPRTWLPRAPERFRVAARFPEDGVVDLRALRAALEERVRGNGMPVQRGVQVQRIETTSEAELQTSHGRMRAEIVIVAAGANLPQLVPFCRFKIVGMRAQWLHAAVSQAAAAPADVQAWSAVHGRELWRRTAANDLLVTGSRALPVQRELGARSGTSPEVQALLEANANEFAAGARIQARGAGVVALACDDLPLAGPVPGHPRLLVVGGFGNNEPGLVFAAAEVAAQLVLHGRAAHASVFTPRRFL